MSFPRPVQTYCRLPAVLYFGTSSSVSALVSWKMLTVVMKSWFLIPKTPIKTNAVVSLAILEAIHAILVPCNLYAHSSSSSTTLSGLQAVRPMFG